MKKLSLAYFGTPYFSARFLEKLLTDISIKHLIEIKLVVTQPDQPVGRKQILTKSSVKTVAEKFGVEVFDSEIRNSQFAISKLKSLDLAFLFAYGNIIPKNLLNTPKYGFLNTHPSLLPKYRGSSPIAYPLMLGDKKTGVTLIKLDEKIDHGPIIAQEELKINPTDRRPDLEIKLTNLAFRMFKHIILSLFQDLSRHSGLSRIDSVPIQSGPRMRSKPQNHIHATYTRLLTKNDGFVPFESLKKAISNQPRQTWLTQLTTEETPKIIKNYYEKNNLTMKQFNNETIYNLFRGLYPWPGIWTKIEPPRLRSNEVTGKHRRLNEKMFKRLKITDMDYSNGKITIKKVQLEGKKEVDFETFNRAYSIF